MMGVNADESLSFLSFLLTKPLTNHIYEAAIHLLFGDMAGQVLDTYPSEVIFLISCVIFLAWRKNSLLLTYNLRRKATFKSDFGQYFVTFCVRLSDLNFVDLLKCGPREKSVT